MFIRNKRVKKYNYGYLVKTRWTKKGPRQKVSKYLGRVVEPSQVREVPYHEYVKPGFAENAVPKEIVKSLVSWVLYCHGFERTRSTWKNGGVAVSLGTIRVHENGRKAVVKMNGDYLCDYTLRRLLRFQSSKGQEETGAMLAKAFVGAGIPVPADVFVTLFTQIYKSGQTYL